MHSHLHCTVINFFCSTGIITTLYFFCALALDMIFFFFLVYTQPARIARIIVLVHAAIVLPMGKHIFRLIQSSFTVVLPCYIYHNVTVL